MNDSQLMAALIEDHLSFSIPTVGKLKKGFVVDHRGGFVLVDIGAKSEAIIPADEVDSLDKAIRQKLEIGNEVEVLIVDPEDDDGNIIVSILKALEGDDWIAATEQKKSNDTCECRVVGCNRGGLLIRFLSLSGFMPKSQIGYDHNIGRNASKEDMRRLVGLTLQAKIIEVDQQAGKLVFSERAATQDSRELKKRSMLAKLDVGQRHSGKVVNLTDYGAFIDIDGLVGLLHLSEMSHKHISHPRDMLKMGEEVEVVVLNVDLEKERVTFSIKELEGDPWEDIDAHYQVGQLVEVTITQLTNYGAFARINDEYRLDGLIHISELSDEHIKMPHEVVQKGETVAVRLIRIDRDNKRIGLSIKQVASADFLEQDLQAQAASEEAQS